MGFFPGAKVLTGAAATEAALREMRGPAVVHIATHGYFEPLHCDPDPDNATAPDDPRLQSGLAMAGANACYSPIGQNERKDGGDERDHDDGLLTSVELAALDMHGTKLAVLSACDTGLGGSDIRDAWGRRHRSAARESTACAELCFWPAPRLR